MSLLHLTIKGPPRSKKNSMQAICRNGKPRLIQSKLYRDYEADALKQLMAWGNRRFEGLVEVTCVYFCPDRRKRDLTNLLAATHDILEKSQIISDDANIYSVDRSRIYFQPSKDPRVEVWIKELEDDQQS